MRRKMPPKLKINDMIYWKTPWDNLQAGIVLRVGANYYAVLWSDGSISRLKSDLFKYIQNGEINL
jgi:hypothetical protein